MPTSLAGEEVRQRAQHGKVRKDLVGAADGSEATQKQRGGGREA